MTEKIPLLVVSDSPCLGTGLGRIARELTTRIHQFSNELGVRVGQLGFYHDRDRDTEWPWPVWKIEDEEDYGAGDLGKVWWKFAGERGGVVLTIWDPARAFNVALEARKLPVRLWGYFPVDGQSVIGGVGGMPAVATVKEYDRVLGYGRWGASVLKTATQKPVQYLPHGLDLDVWRPRTSQKQGDGEHNWELKIVKEYIGCVMTNQPRKDMATLFAAWQQIAVKRADLKFWLHTDLEVKYWSVPQLAADFGIEDRLTVTLGLDDEQLAEWYSACWATMLPSLGEGFGYPIVESLACGVPCVVFDGAGGRELAPRALWRVRERATRVESCHNIVRPVFDPGWWARQTLATLDWAKTDSAAGAYCQGAVAHLDWTKLFGRWASWIRQGVKEIRG